MRTISAGDAAKLSSVGYSPSVRVSLEDSGGIYRDVDAYFEGQKFLVGVSISEDVDGQGPCATVTLKREIFSHSLSPLMTSSGAARGYVPSASPSPVVALYRRVKVEFGISAVDDPSAPSFSELYIGRVDAIDLSDETVVLECREANCAILSDAYFERERLYGLTPAAYAVQKGCLIWSPGEAQAVGDLMVPTTLNGYLYRATSISTGVSGSTEPTWPTTIGATVVDGGVTWTCGVATATAGVSMEAVIQQMLNDGPGGVTLYAPDVTSFLMNPWKQDRVPILEAVRSVAALIGWDVRPRYDAGDVYRFQLYKPDRAATTSLRTFGTSSYVNVSKLAIALDDIRNVVQVVYGDAADLASDGKTRKRKARRVTDSASVTAYGRRYMEIAEDATSQIDTASEADAMANAALSDLSTPTADLEVEAFFFPWAQLGDLYTFSANGVHFDNDQLLAVVGYAHDAQLDSSGGYSFRTRIRVRGKPSGGQDRWTRWGTRPGGAEVRPLQDSLGGLTLSLVSALVGGARFKVSEQLSRNARWDGFELHLSSSSGFTPSSSTLAATSKSDAVEVTNLTPNATYYAKAVSRQTVKGRPVLGATSNQVTFTSGRVTTAHIAPAAVTQFELATDSVVESKIVAAAVSTAKIAGNAVTLSKLDAGVPLAAWDDARGGYVYDRITYVNQGTKSVETNKFFSSVNPTTSATDCYVETNVQFASARGTTVALTYRCRGTGWKTTGEIFRLYNMVNTSENTTAPLLGDGNWHTALFDVSAWLTTGNLRFDLQDGGVSIDAGAVFDVGYFGFGVAGAGASGAGTQSNKQGSVGFGCSQPRQRLEVVGAASDAGGTAFDLAQVIIRDEETDTSGLQVGYRYQAGVTEYGLLQARTVTGASNILLNPSGGGVGIGTSTPQGIPRLYVETLNRWATWTAQVYGDLYVGDASYGVKLGIANSGGGAGAATIAAQGGVNTLSLGAGTTQSQQQAIQIASGITSIVQASWTAVTFENTFLNFDAVNYQPAAYFKDSQGFVRLRGLVKRATALLSSNVFTLPSGFRPAKNANFATVANNKFARIEIDTLGQVRVVAADDASWFSFFSLDGISFDTR